MFRKMLMLLLAVFIMCTMNACSKADQEVQMPFITLQ